MRILFVLLLLASPCYAADKALILSDKEQKDLISIMDAATRSQGLSIVPATANLLYKLQNAGTVTEQKEIEPDKPDAKRKLTPRVGPQR
jgi:hypothetical protein